MLFAAGVAFASSQEAPSCPQLNEWYGDVQGLSFEPRCEPNGDGRWMECIVIMQREGLPDKGVGYGTNVRQDLAEQQACSRAQQYMNRQSDVVTEELNRARSGQ